MGPGRLLRVENVLGSYREAVAGRIVAAIHQPEQFDHLTGSRRVLVEGRIASEQRPAAFMRKGLGAVLPDALRQIRAHRKLKAVGHCYVSSQKCSLRYFDAESAKIVTSTAGSPAGIRCATASVPTSAAAALGLTSNPSSRARRLTIR